MRIQNDDVAGAGGIRAPASDAQQRAKTPARAGDDRAPIEDSVETSAIAAEVAGDAEKVERLRAAVQSGAYIVDAKELAAKIVAEHLRERE